MCARLATHLAIRRPESHALGHVKVVQVHTFVKVAVIQHNSICFVTPRGESTMARLVRHFEGDRGSRFPAQSKGVFEEEKHTPVRLE